MNEREPGTDWITGEYFSFWDVPRTIVFTYRGKSVLLDSPFEEEQDEFRSSYYVWEVGLTAHELDLEVDWNEMEQHKLRRLTDLPIGSLRFDSVRERKGGRSFARFCFKKDSLAPFEAELFGSRRSPSES